MVYLAVLAKLTVKLLKHLKPDFRYKKMLAQKGRFLGFIKPTR
jgi:hypothetical protein